MSVCTTDGSAFPTATCTAFTAPESFAAGTVTFTASPAMTLAAGTTYTVMVDPGGDNLTRSHTSISDEDSGGAAGWSLADAYHFKNSMDNWQVTGSGYSFRVTLKGTIVTGTDITPPSPSISEVAPTGVQVSLVFNEALDVTVGSLSAAVLAAFTLTVDGVDRDIESASAASTVTLRFQLQSAAVIYQGQTVTLSYDKTAAGTDALEDADGNEVVSFTDRAVNNQSAVVNTAPTASAGAVTTLEDTAYTFGAANFNFSDTNPGHTLESVKITSLPTAGTLSVDGMAIVSGGLPKAVSKADIDAARLTYAPVPDASGSATFNFKVNDGLADSALAYVMTVTITAVNDAPTVATGIPDRSATAGTSFSYAFPANTFNDVDTGDTLSYTATQADGVTALPMWLTFTATTRTFSGTPQAADAGTVSVKVTATDGNGGSVSDTFVITVNTTLNNPPVFPADTAARSVPENTAAGQDVGAVLTATDPDSDTLIYTLEGTDAASFDIVTTSGSAQIRTRTGVTYNHEAKSSYTVIVKADDSKGDTDTVTVTITVTDVNEPPGVPAAPSVSATAGTTTSLDVTWTAPSNTGPAITSYDLQYRRGTIGNFTNGPQDVTGTSVAIGSLAPNASYQVQVRATNAEGDSNWSFSGTGQTTTSAPGAPTGLSATASGSTRIDLSWTAPASTGGSPITGYRIEFSSDGGSSWNDLAANTASTSTTHSDTSLGVGTTRHYRVSAINTNGTGPASNTANASNGTGQTTVTFGASLYTAVEGGAAATVTVQLSAAPSAPVTIPLVVTPLGTTTAADHSGIPASVMFTADQTTVTFDVTATSDGVGDGGESVSIGFGPLLPGVVLGARPTAVVALSDGSEQRFVVDFSTSWGHTIQARERGVRRRLRVLLRDNKWAPGANPRQPLTIPLVVTHRGGATAADYSPIPASVTIPAGRSEAVYYVRALPDEEDETGEGLRIDFGPLPPGVAKGDWGPYETIEFLDAVLNDVLPKLTVLFGASSYTATEGGAAARVSLHLNEPVVVAPAEVRLRLEYGGGATAADHGSIPTLVRFAVGSQTQTITVAATDDRVNDDGESVSLTLVDDPNNRLRVRSRQNSTRVALEDNDGVERVTVSFGAATYTATERGADATVRVALDAAPGRAVTVPLAVTYAGGATVADHSAIPASVTFAADQTASVRFTVTATPDTDVDGGESVRLGFGTLPDGVFAGSPATASVALADGGEQKFVVSFSTNWGHTVQAREGGVRKRLRVLLRDSRWAPSANPRRPLTIPLVVTHRGGATEADYMPIPGSVTIAAGRSEAVYYVRALPDEEDETGEGLRIDFGPLPPGLTKNPWGPYETIEFVDAGAAAQANVSVAGPLLRLGYPGPLDGGSQPSPRDFVVSAEAPDGVRAMVAVTAVSVRGSDVLLELDRPVRPEETVTLSYLAAAMHPIREAAGRPAPPLADEPVRNETGASGPLEETALAAGTAVPAPLAILAEEAQEGAGTERLDLSSRNLTDVSALAGLTGLRELDLRNNSLADLGPLAGLTGLRALHLSGNRIEDLSPLAGLTALEQLSLAGNRIEDLAPLTGLAGLRALDLSGNRIEDFWPLAGLAALERLNLADNRVAEIATLAQLTGLRVLDLAGNRIEDLWPLAGLAALERLNLADNRIEDLWPLAGLSGLQVLLLDRNRVSDLVALSPLPGLENLGLSGNRIADIGLLAQLGGLRRLDLSENAVAEVSALGDVSGLVWLRLAGNPVSGAAPLVRLENLRWLWLDPGTTAGMEVLAPPPAGRGAAQLWIEWTPAQ